MKRVLISAGGRRFHETGDCKAVEAAQLIWDNDEWTAPSHPWESVSITDAMGRGKEPCAICFPGLRDALYRGNAEDDYGHQPTAVVNAIGQRVVCARCRTSRRVWWVNGGCYVTDTVQVPWPCTSAIVLGLVAREEAAA